MQVRFLVEHFQVFYWKQAENFLQQLWNSRVQSVRVQRFWKKPICKQTRVQRVQLSARDILKMIIAYILYRLKLP